MNGFLQILYDMLHRGRVLRDEKLSSPGFSGVKQRVPWYSLLASRRVLGPQTFASTKMLLVSVTSIEESCTHEYPGVFLKGVQL